MRNPAIGCLLSLLGLMVPANVTGQTSSQPPAPTPGAAAPAPQAPAQAAPAAEAEPTRSLFEQTWRQATFGGRFNSISGDPARFQRYQDMRDGVYFSDARYAFENPAGAWLFRAGADNVGYRDQRYFADYERTGFLRVSGLWDQIPQFYSVDTRTPYLNQGGEALVLDDATQQRIQNGQANLNAWVPLATQFDLIEERKIGQFSVLATPSPSFDIKAGFKTTRHSGELPWGASFGFGNDVEVALPYDSRTNDFTVGAEWMKGRSMLRVAYDGSWFDNLDPVLVWDSPLRLTDSTSAPGRGRTTLWPTNTAQTFSAAGYTKLARKTQLTGFVSYGVWSNDEVLQPFTINPTLPQFALPRATAEADAHVFSTNLNLVSRPATEWRFSARLRRYDFDNQTPHTDIPQFINYDTSVKASATGGPEPYSHARTTFTGDATWTGLSPLALTAGYTHNSNSYDFRIFESTGEDTLNLSADAIGLQWVTFRAQYELSDRSGSGLDEQLLVQIGEQPALRHFDIANRTRNRFTGQVDVMPSEPLILSASFGGGKDEYDDSYFGLQEATFKIFTLSADYQREDGLGGGASYNFERYSGFQQSRTASPGQTPDQVTDPNRDWTADSAEKVHYFSIYVTPPRIGATEARLSYDYSNAKSDYVYGVVPGGPVPVPSQLPQVYNKLQQFKLDVRHRLSNKLAANLSYLYEPFKVYDFAFDETVINGIVQPSSLILGYVYRPYTAHQAIVGLTYFW